MKTTQIIKDTPNRYGFVGKNELSGHYVFWSNALCINNGDPINGKNWIFQKILMDLKSYSLLLGVPDFA